MTITAVSNVESTCTQACVRNQGDYVPLLHHTRGVCGSNLGTWNVCHNWISPEFPQHFQLNAKI